MATQIRGRAETPSEGGAMSLSGHLSELRQRLIVSFIAFVLAAVVAYVFYDQILRFFLHPYCVQARLVGPKAHLCVLTVFGPLDAFMVRLNVTAYGGIFLASPIIVFELWRFVTPGLKANEKRYAIPFAVSTVALFFLGAFVAWLTFPHALGFLHAVGGSNINDLFTPSKYLGLIIALMVIFGATFEFPVVLVGLEIAGVLKPEQLAHWRRPAIVIIVIFAGVVTPSSDPFSMLAMAVPMLLFYEASIHVGKFLTRKRRRAKTT
jgi:sec-independent protein translocase protein TatC